VWRILVLLLMIIVLLGPPSAVRGQTEPRLSSVEVWLWPEYDAPTALVILRMVVAANVSLPMPMTFRIPARAEKPHALAVGPSFDQIADRVYKLERDGEWLKVEVTVDERAIQLEYYDPALIKQGADRSYRFVWPGDYAVENLHVEVQQPFDATAMSIDPYLPNVTPSENRLIYYSNDFGPLGAGQTFELSFRYQKASDTLTVSFLRPEPATSLGENVAGRITLNTYRLWLIGIFVLLTVALGAAWYYYRSSASSRPARRRHRPRSERAETDLYCHQCGTRAQRGDRFCRVCGARLRTGAD